MTKKQSMPMFPSAQEIEIKRNIENLKDALYKTGYSAKNLSKALPTLMKKLAELYIKHGIPRRK